MFELPSIWNLVVSTIVFFIAAWYAHRYLDEHGLPQGMTRGILVFAMASLVSWAAGAAADWTQEKIEGPQVAKQPGSDLSQLLRAVGEVQQSH